MTSLSAHHSSEYTKLLLIGDSGTGKTGALASLVEAGYKLRILDLDNGLDSLKSILLRDFPAGLDKVDFVTMRDKYKAGPLGIEVAGVPKAYVNSLKLLESWEDGSDPAEWGADTIFVLDSMSSLGRAAFAWAKGMNPGAKDGRNWYFTAQRSIESFIDKLTSEAFHTNLIVISHITLVELNDGSTKGYPSTLGTALSKQIGKYFNTILLAETSGSGEKVRRTIRTAPTMTIDLKAPVLDLDVSFPLGTALASIFEKLRSNKL